jgi:predicted nuclease of restriction endonuclease-like (RecB) superfamily
VLLDKMKDSTERLWYIQQAIVNGWSRNILVMQIEGGLYRRQGKAVTNFQQNAFGAAVRSRSGDPQRSIQLRLSDALQGGAGT